MMEARHDGFGAICGNGLYRKKKRYGYLICKNLDEIFTVQKSIDQ